MRRCLLILPLLLLTAPAVAHAGGLATVRLSSTPDGLRASQPWRVALAIRQPGRAPRSDLRPAVVVRDADGNRPTHRALPPPPRGHHPTAVRLPPPRPGTH